MSPKVSISNPATSWVNANRTGGGDSVNSKNSMSSPVLNPLIENGSFVNSINEAGTVTLT